MTLAEVRKTLRQSAEPEYRRAQKWFFKEPVNLYGVRAARRRPIEQAIYREIKSWPPAERNHYVEKLWKSRMLEEGVIACHVYRRFRKQCGKDEFRMFERWLDRYVGNWAHCDGVAGWLLAASIANVPALARELEPWTRSANRWRRRAAAVALIQEGKAGRNLPLILKIATRLTGDPDDMVQKGVGWMLKETYPKKPREVVKFLTRNSSRFSRLTLRYAAEKMTAKDRASVLG